MIFYPLIFFLLPDQIFNVVYPRLEFPVEGIFDVFKMWKILYPGGKKPQNPKNALYPGGKLSITGIQFTPSKGDTMIETLPKKFLIEYIFYWNFILQKSSQDGVLMSNRWMFLSFIVSIRLFIWLEFWVFRHEVACSFRICW